MLVQKFHKHDSINLTCGRDETRFIMIKWICSSANWSKSMNGYLRVHSLLVWYINQIICSRTNCLIYEPNHLLPMICLIYKPNHLVPTNCLIYSPNHLLPSKLVKKSMNDLQVHSLLICVRYRSVRVKQASCLGSNIKEKWSNKDRKMHKMIQDRWHKI